MSLANNKYNFIFVHIPKTAGTSMEQVPFMGESYNKHAPIMFYRAMENLANLEIDNYFKWCFVRDPYTRFISGMLSHVINTELKGLNDNQIRNKITEFVLKGEFGGEVLRPQHEFVEVEGKNVMDFLGRFENINEDWSNVCKRIGVQPVDLPHKMKGNYTNYDYYYTPETRAIISKHYKKDFKMFGYKI